MIAAVKVAPSNNFACQCGFEICTGCRVKISSHKRVPSQAQDGASACLMQDAGALCLGGVGAVLGPAAEDEDLMPQMGQRSYLDASIPTPLHK